MKSLNRSTIKAKRKTLEIPVNKPVDSGDEQPDGILSTLRMDMRTNTAKQLTTIREAIARNPAETASGIVRDLLAVNALLMKEIVKEMSESDMKLLTEDGEVNPLVSKVWFQVQAGIVQSAKSILALENAAKQGPASATARSASATGTVDVTTIILEASNND